LVDALGCHLEKHNAKVVEQLLSEIEKRNTVSWKCPRVRYKTYKLATSMKPTPSSPISFAKDAAGFVAILQSFWLTLPSPEARAARLSSAARPFSAGAGGRTSPNLRAGAWGLGSSSPSVVSISDMSAYVLGFMGITTPGFV
jgi:hypothetical protein